MPEEAHCLKSTVQHPADTRSHITLNSAFLLVLLSLGTGNAFPFEQAMCLGLPFSPHIKGNYSISKPLSGPWETTPVLSARGPRPQPGRKQQPCQETEQWDRSPNRADVTRPKSLSIWVRRYCNMGPSKITCDPIKTPQLSSTSLFQLSNLNKQKSLQMFLSPTDTPKQIKTYSLLLNGGCE